MWLSDAFVTIVEKIQNRVQIQKAVVRDDDVFKMFADRREPLNTEEPSKWDLDLSKESDLTKHMGKIKSMKNTYGPDQWCQIQTETDPCRLDILTKKTTN